MIAGHYATALIAHQKFPKRDVVVLSCRVAISRYLLVHFSLPWA